MALTTATPTITTTPTTAAGVGTTADQELKARHRVMWALGNYPAVADEVIPDLGVELVRASGIGPGQDVLDVPAGSGNVAIPAALTGAHVVAADLTPRLLEAGAATPPPGVPRWGEEQHVRGLLGERVDLGTAERRVLVVDRFPGPEAFRDYCATNYGPTVALYRAHAADPERLAALDAALVDVARRFDRGSARYVMEWEYLLLVGRRH